MKRILEVKQRGLIVFIARVIEQTAVRPERNIVEITGKCVRDEIIYNFNLHISAGQNNKAVVDCQIFDETGLRFSHFTNADDPKDVRGLEVLIDWEE